MQKIVIALAAAMLVSTACSGKSKPVQQIAEENSVEYTESQEETPAGTKAQPDTESEPKLDETSKESETGISQVLDQIDWKKKKEMLPKIQELLDQENIIYTGTFNQSGERLDLVLEDGTTMLFLAAADSQGSPLGYELMMLNEEFNSNGFQEDYLNQYDVTTEEEYYPETDKKAADPEAVSEWNQTDISIARNEIYARHGRIFEDPFLNAVFRVKTWYQPEYDGAEFSAIESSVLNKNEKDNLKFLIQKERELGYRPAEGENYNRPARLLSGSWLDLDGDGVKEQITYKVEHKDSYGTDQYHVMVNGMSLSGEGQNAFLQLYAGSLDGVSVQLLAALCGDSADYYMEIYTYEKGLLKEAGILPGSPAELQIMKDRVYTFTKYDHFQTRNAKCQYEFKNGVVQEVMRDFYEHGNKAKALTEILLYESPEDGKMGLTLQPDDQVIILGGDNKEWICIQKTDGGKQGWLRVEGITCILPDGSKAEAWDLFDGLTYWG